MRNIEDYFEGDYPTERYTDVSADTHAGTTAPNGKEVWTVDQIAAHLNRTGDQWYETDNEITFGFVQSKEQLPEYNRYTFLQARLQEFQAFTPQQMEATRSAIKVWDDLVAVNFRESTDMNEAQIRYMGTGVNGPAQAAAYLPFADPANPDPDDSIAGDVYVNWRQGSNGALPGTEFNLKDGFYGVQTLQHETGHALGLSHPGAYNFGPGFAVTYANGAEYFQDTRQYSIMSYWDFYETKGDAQHIDWNTMRFVYASTPMVHDIAAIQAIYGVDTTTRTGDTVYGFNSNTDMSAYTLTSNELATVFTIWDAGGNDTLDLSGYATPSEIDLTPGEFSSGGGRLDFLSLEAINANNAALGFTARSEALYQNYMVGTPLTPEGKSFRELSGSDTGLMKDNFGIAYGAVIENAIGGSGDDVLRGNDVANRLEGGAGADRLAGGNGIDSLIGGEGNDIFVGEINAVAVNTKEGLLSIDLVLDFANGADKIDLSGIDANLTLEGDQAFNFKGKSSGNKAGDLFYKTYGNMHAAEKVIGFDLDGDGKVGGAAKDGQVAVLFGNIDGDKAAEFALVLVGTSDLSSTDIMFG